MVTRHEELHCSFYIHSSVAECSNIPSLYYAISHIASRTPSGERQAPPHPPVLRSNTQTASQPAHLTSTRTAPFPSQLAIARALLDLPARGSRSTAGLPSPPLHPEPPVRRPLGAQLRGAQPPVDLLDAHELLHLHDHARELRLGRVEDGLAAAVEPQGGEDAARPLGEADG